MFQNVSNDSALGYAQSQEQRVKILHIEDSPADQTLARLSLKRGQLPCQLTIVDSLQATEAALQTQNFDLILADYHLPGFTALDVWELVRRRPEHPPFVLLSGAIGESAAVDIMRLGISDYLLKDQIASLPHVVKRALEVHEARRARRRAMQELAASEKRLAELTEHLHTSIEQERAGISREIHDDIGGSLTAVKFDLAWIQRNSPEGALREHAQSALQMLEHALGASQRIMQNLRPPVLDQGLLAAIQWLVQDFERRTGIPAKLQVRCQQTEFAPELQVVVYRTAQEALTNISKYAKASRVSLELSDHEDFLTLEVTDDGVGLSPADREKPQSFGLRGLNERARTVQGWLDVSSQPGQGSSIILTIPLTDIKT
ncbi:MAG: histidine kinase [Comamonas sp.]|jgi:signal transduction histidine kinase|uniref:hybrid sensor histidine kinase/response regulator n=1 Tax=Comamonas sp. TaxID=34028 RepID=UPI00281973AD|nr:ATP-binding protein [Comamonas sp.]MDR0213257.1 histidine kinase [Comamonas sp.]